MRMSQIRIVVEKIEKKALNQGLRKKRAGKGSEAVIVKREVR